MMLLLLERVPPGLRGELTRWLLELRAGVFVGTVSASVREKLWERVQRDLKGGGAIMVRTSDSEQGFRIIMCGYTDRLVEDHEGLSLVRIPSKEEESL
jgi:CRISPR-associated protein Cas2